MFNLIHSLAQKVSYTWAYDLDEGVKATKNKCNLNLSQVYIHASLIIIHSLVQEISNFQENNTICMLAFDLDNKVKVTKR